MSLNEVTIRAVLVVGLAIVALVFSGWRKTARAQTRLRRASEHDAASGHVPTTPKRVPIEVRQAPTEAYHRPGPIRRLWALASSAGLVLIIGAVVATLIAFAVAISITVLTDMLQE